VTLSILPIVLHAGTLGVKPFTGTNVKPIPRLA
jgi:hypothetical protein